MTQEQAKRLCELEPERFRPWAYGLDYLIDLDDQDARWTILVNLPDGFDYRQVAMSNLYSLCWWMLTQMPDVILSAPIIDGNWSCDDSRLERYGASRETPEEAVISAYIEWLESRQTK